MGKFVDLTGQRFGRLVVINLLTSKGAKRHKWLCKCDCGNECAVLGYNLVGGRTKSCGCLRKEVASQLSKSKARLSKSKARKITYSFYEDYIIGDDGRGHQFMIDNDDFDRIKERHWTYNGRYWSTYIKIDDKRTQVTMHTFIIQPKDGYVIDHADRNRSNNRKYNLRYATVSQNSMNSTLRKNNSGITGVMLDKRRNKWRAVIKLNQKSIWLGGYADKDDAIKARLLAEAKYFGDFAPQRHLFKQYGIEVDNEEQAN